jgi:acetyl esterase
MSHEAYGWNAPRSLAETLQACLVRLLLRLPPALQGILSGKPLRHHGENTLHPELQLLLSLMQRAGARPLTEVPAVKGRWRLRRNSFVFAGPAIEVGAVKAVAIPTSHAPSGRIAARHYTPPGDPLRRRPLLVFFHGGGFSLGDLETHDVPCRLLCREADVHILSVDYRLAPEYPFPAALEDAEAAFAWALQRAETLGADPALVAAGGDSCGANLAAVIGQVRAQKGERQPALQLLIYPLVDCAGNYPSRKRFGRGFLLTADDISRFGARYAPGVNPSDSRLSPLRGATLAGLSPTLVITASFDPLADEGEAYAHALAQAGSPARLVKMPDMAHGFINLIGLSPACHEATRQIASALGAEFDALSRLQAAPTPHVEKAEP